MIEQAPGHLHRQACFPYAARTCDRNEPHVMTQQEFPGGSDFFRPPHEAGPLHGKIRGEDLCSLNRFLGEWVAADSRVSRHVTTRDLGLRLDHSDEAVPPAGDGLDETWLLRVVLQYLANFADSSVDAVVGVEENVFAPDSFDNLVAGHKLRSRLN